MPKQYKEIEIIWISIGTILNGPNPQNTDNFSRLEKLIEE